MALHCECRIPGYHGDKDWIEVTNVHGLQNAVETFVQRMDRKDFELFMREDEAREVWVRQLGKRKHKVFAVSYTLVKQFNFDCEENDL